MCCKQIDKVKPQPQGGVERQQQDRELLTQQEEEQRQLRKKVHFKNISVLFFLHRVNTDICLQRIEEIMKRTRKGEADMKVL